MIHNLSHDNTIFLYMFTYDEEANFLIGIIKMGLIKEF